MTRGEYIEVLIVAVLLLCGGIGIGVVIVVWL